MSTRKSKSPPQRPRKRAQPAATAPQASAPGEERDYSVNALSKLLGYDRRTIDKALVGLEPTRLEGKTKFYRLRDVENAMRQKKSEKLRDQKLFEEIRKLRIANDREEGKVVAKSKVSEAIRRCMGPMAATLEQRLVNEYPTGVVGLDVPQARIYGKRLCDELLAFCQQFEKEWAI